MVEIRGEILIVRETEGRGVVVMQVGRGIGRMGRGVGVRGMVGGIRIVGGSMEVDGRVGGIVEGIVGETVDEIAGGKAVIVGEGINRLPSFT